MRSVLSPCPVSSRAATVPSNLLRQAAREFAGRGARFPRRRGAGGLTLVLDDCDVELTTRLGVIHGVFRTTGAIARLRILAGLPALKESLRRRGLRVGLFEVRVVRPADFLVTRPPARLDLLA